MRRPQLYLEEYVWKLLQTLARQAGCSVSHLVRQAVREKYFDPGQNRRRAFEAVVGLWVDQTDLPNTETYVCGLRNGSRQKRLGISKA